MKVTAAQLDEARDYYVLCATARDAGVPTSLDDPRSPRTVTSLCNAAAAPRP